MGRDRDPGGVFSGERVGKRANRYKKSGKKLDMGKVTAGLWTHFAKYDQLVCIRFKKLWQMKELDLARSALLPHPARRETDRRQTDDRGGHVYVRP